MGAQIDILLLTEMFGVPVILIVLAAAIIYYEIKQEKTRKWAQEKVIELTEKGHDAKLCSKCNGKGRIWGGFENCPECDGQGYIFKLRECEEDPRNADNKSRLQKCANCGRTIGKLKKSYVFKYQIVCAECHQRLESQK